MASINHKHAEWHDANKYKHKHTIFLSNYSLLLAIIAAMAFSSMLKES